MRYFTLNMLRNDFRNYSNYRNEILSIAKIYTRPLREMNEKLKEIDYKMVAVGSPSFSKAPGGCSKYSKAESLDHLIECKESIINEMHKYIAGEQANFYNNVAVYRTLISGIDEQLTKIEKEKDRQYIADFYLNNDLKTNDILEKYNILNINSLHRKADNILIKLLS